MARFHKAGGGALAALVLLGATAGSGHAQATDRCGLGEGSGATHGPLWTTLPPTPPLPPPPRQGRLAVPGSQIWYGDYGPRGGDPPVLLLHGGLGNSAYFGRLIPALVKSGRRVIAMDSRGHGRSAPSELPFSYALMARDVVALLDHLRVAKADIVGWSDGGTIGYELAIHAPARVNRLMAFGANATLDGLIKDVAETPTFAAYIARTGSEYRALAPDPARYDRFLPAVSRMWEAEPNIGDDDLRRITVPVTIALGQYDEGVKRAHAEHLADTIPAANLLVLPNVSHFAMLQCPKQFDSEVMRFLEWR